MNNRIKNILKRIYKLYAYRYQKYKQDVDDGIVLIDASNGFSDTTRQIYEKLLYDEKFNSIQIVVGLRNKKLQKPLIKEVSTVKVKKNSLVYPKYCARAKYIILDQVNDTAIKLKREQVLVVANRNDNNYGKRKKKRIQKYENKYINYNVSDIDTNISKSNIKKAKKDFYNKYGLKEDKILVNYKIDLTKFNEFCYEDFYDEKKLDLLYDKFKDKYQIIINNNRKFDEPLNLEKYNGFYVDLSSVEEMYIDYFSDILITNADIFYETKKYNEKNKLYYTNYLDAYSEELKEMVRQHIDPNIDDIVKFLDNYKLVKNDDRPLNLNLDKICNDIILLKQGEKHTLSYLSLKKKLLTPIKDLKIKVVGFLRTHVVAISKNSRRLKKYINAYEGKRCFLIGNGPSLTIEDLELLKNEITFGCNMIYKIYDKTTWRPTFYFLADGMYARRKKGELIDNIQANTFGLKHFKKSLKDYDGKFEILYFDSLSAIQKGRYKVVSPLAYHYSGGSVMSLMLCEAMDMGFKEIYLLGVDATSSLSNNGHFVKGYMDKKIKRLDMKRVASKLNKTIVTEDEVADYYHDRVMDMYSVIEDYAKKHGIKIYNCTRGGVLEVYERKNLEDVLESNEV